MPGRTVEEALQHEDVSEQFNKRGKFESVAKTCQDK